ncbi:IS701 family transposase ISMdi28 [subsurface metagenome]
MTHDELRAATVRLRKFLTRYRPHMGRQEVQALIQTYVRGLLSDTRKRNAEGIALEVGSGRVRALQRMLVSARWDEDAVVCEHQRAVTELMGSDDGILVVDDTGFRKKGVFSCGVGRQYSGTLGKVDNCQIGVFLSYAVPEKGHTLLDRRLFLKKEWFTPEWAELRERAHVPEGVVFRTKPELALEMIDGARLREVPHSWVNMDADYGKAPWLLDALDDTSERYAAQVPSTTRVWTELPKTYIPPRKGKRGPRPRKPRLEAYAPASRTVARVAKELPRKAFKPAILREGEKGPIRVEVAGLRVWNKRNRLPGREEHLVIVRRFGQEPKTKYVLSNAPAKTPRMAIAYAGLARWSEEQCFEQGKDDLGLGQYQTKTWPGWKRHVTLVMLGHSFLHWLDARGEKTSRTCDSTAAQGDRRARA